MLPLSLYIHIPWCIRKCPYCDFNSHKSPENLPEDTYVDSLIADLTNDVNRFPARVINSVFIGGGTPSLFDARSYEKLFNAIQKQITFASDIEITLEANPGTVEQQRFNDYRALGINRLSLGIQSFNAKHLKKLGRIHDDTEANRAIKCARIAGFDNLNIDIMHGLPEQTISEGIDDLQTALSYEPEHLSWYQLTIEPNTVFYKQRPTLPSEDETCAIEEQGLALLFSKQFERYEISAFCQSKKQALHNLNYWRFGDYYGIGAGAHGKLTSNDGTCVWRTQKHRQPTDYLSQDKPFLSSINQVSETDLIFEFMLNTTRLHEKIALSLFTDRTGLSIEKLLPGLHIAKQKGLINFDEKSWQVTDLGRRFTNNLQTLFL